MTKTFSSSKALDKWLDSPLNARLYKVLFVDKTTNTLKLEGKPISWEK
jgi:hypothetical protein